MDIVERLRKHAKGPVTLWAEDWDEAADEIEQLKLIVRNLQHKLNEATDARDRARARGDLAMEFIRMAMKDMELG